MKCNLNKILCGYTTQIAIYTYLRAEKDVPLCVLYLYIWMPLYPQYSSTILPQNTDTSLPLTRILLHINSIFVLPNANACKLFVIVGIWCWCFFCVCVGNVCLRHKRKTFFLLSQKRAFQYIWNRQKSYFIARRACRHRDSIASGMRNERVERCSFSSFVWRDVTQTRWLLFGKVFFTPGIPKRTRNLCLKLVWDVH